MMQNKIIKMVFGGACAVLLFGMFSSEGREPERHVEQAARPDIKIGVTLPLSGELSDIGITSKNTLQMALDKWKQRKTKYNYSLIFKDDEFSSRQANLNGNRLVNVNRVDALLSILSPAAGELNSIALNNKVIHMACAPGAKPARGIYNFNNNTQFEPLADLMLEQLKERNISSIAFLVLNDPIAQEQGTVLQQKIREDGTIKIVGRKVFNHGEKSYDKLVRSILKNGEPDIFYVDGLYPDAENIARSIKKITGKLNLTTINDFVETRNPNLFEGLWFVTSAFGKDEFVAEYEQKYGAPLYVCGANSYDNLNLLIWAYEQTPPREGKTVPDNEDVVKTILDLKDWHGAIGMFRVRNDGVLISEPQLKQIVNGKAKDLFEGKVFR